jgi:hypothetical protein
MMGMHQVRTFPWAYAFYCSNPQTPANLRDCGRISDRPIEKKSRKDRLLRMINLHWTPRKNNIEQLPSNGLVVYNLSCSV